MSFIKVYRSTDQGAPALSGSATAIAFFDAVLVNGYGEVSVGSITRSGTTATVTTSAPHGLASGDIALISGANETAYNGEFPITRQSATTFTYSVSGSPATPATGTMLCRRAPAGFAKPFAATNKGVYRSNDTSGLRHYLRVADEGTTAGGFREAVVRGFATMTDVDTGGDPFPSTAQLTAGLAIFKSFDLNTAVRPWMLITDGKTLYLFVFPANGNNTPTLAFAFGDFIPTRPNDTYASFIAGMPLGITSWNQVDSGLMSARAFSDSYTASSTTLYSPRNFTAAGAAQPMSIYLNHAGNPGTLGGLYIAYPHTPDNGFYMMPLMISQPWLLRGRIPGMYESVHGACFLHDTVVENIQGLPGRKLLFTTPYRGPIQNALGLLFDITGPWS